MIYGTSRCSRATSGSGRRGLRASRGGRKEFGFPLFAIKCLSALFRLVSHAPCFSHRLLNHVCLPPPRPLGGDRDYAGGGQRRGAGLPLASPHRHRRARHRDGALLLKGKLCLVEQLERLAP